MTQGGSAIVARKMGAGETVRASQDFTLIIGAGALFGVIITVLGTALIDNMIRGLGASGILFPYCKEYLSILLLFTPASMLQVLFQNLIVTAGRPGFGMALGISAGAANVTASEKMKTNKAQTIKGKSWFPCIPSGKAGDKCWD